MDQEEIAAEDEEVAAERAAQTGVDEEARTWSMEEAAAIEKDLTKYDHVTKVRLF